MALPPSGNLEVTTMRVYGASPLYNYVELIFRSKRLFIVSIVLATLIVSTLAAMRSSQYTATAMILLTGDSSSGYQSADEAQLGSVRYKLRLFTIFLRNPQFMKDAIRHAISEQTQAAGSSQHIWPDTGQPVAYHFDPNMSDVALDKFCKDARNAINFGQGEGFLELTCRWPDRRAEDILNAFFWEFHDQVVSYETINSTTAQRVLKKLLGEYKSREQAIEKNIIAYQHKNIETPPVQPTEASSNYVTRVSDLEEMQVSMRMAQEQRDTYAAQLKTLQPTIVSSEVSGSPTDNPRYRAALQKRTEAQDALTSLKTRYQDSHPKVREAQVALDAADEDLKVAEKASKASKNIQAITTVKNPDYLRTVAIINQKDAELKGLRATYELKQKQAQAEKQKAYIAGPKNYEFKWLTDSYGIVQTIRTNLENRLHAAELTERQDLERSASETAMLVKPVAEPESSGGKGMLLYAAGPILGLIIAFAFSLVAETLDHSLRTPLEVEKHLGKPVLAVLPRMDPPRASRRQLAGTEPGHATLPPA
jgi:uncharacterized protein involved in exopolysaccharide biosynthesis